MKSKVVFTSKIIASSKKAIIKELLWNVSQFVDGADGGGTLNSLLQSSWDLQVTSSKKGRL